MNTAYSGVNPTVVSNLSRMNVVTEEPGAAALCVGEPFSPWRGTCGFYPPDFVSRLRQVVILDTRRKLTSGHKRLYTLLVRRWGRTGPCFPGQESLANDLGCSVRQVKDWIADLEAFGLIRHLRRGRGPGGRGLTNEYIFLWHPVFEVRSQVVDKITKCKSRNFEVQAATVLKCEIPHASYKEETRTKEAYADGISSSSEKLPEVINNMATATTSVSFSKKASTSGWWTPTELETAKTVLAKHRDPLRYTVNVPDSLLVTQILSHFSNYAEFKAWIEELSRRIPGRNIRSWGFFEHDARVRWPQRRAEVEAQLAEANQKRERERVIQEQAERKRERERQEQEALITKCKTKGWKHHKGVSCKRCAGYGCEPDTEQICSCEAGKAFEYESTACPRCDHSGTVSLSSDYISLVDWCDCRHATDRRARDPDCVERENAMTRKMLECDRRAGWRA